MKKRVFILCLVLVLVFALGACADEKAKLVGDWKTHSGNYEIMLRADGSFILYHYTDTQAFIISGTYTVMDSKRGAQKIYCLSDEGVDWSYDYELIGNRLNLNDGERSWSLLRQ